MRIMEPLIIAGSLVAAVPAMAQDNAAEPMATATPPSDTNAAAPATPTTAAATPGAQDATLPADAAANPAPPTVPADEPDRSFPWGVLGLVGLIGLFGVRKAKG